MTRTLFLFFVRPLQMVAGVLASEAVTVLLLTLGVPRVWVPYAAALLVMTLVPGPVLYVEPIGTWERSWPVPETALVWTRVAPAWLAAWSTVVGAETGATILWAGGALSTEAWIDFSFHALLIFGALPLLSVFLLRRGTTLLVMVAVGALWALEYWFAGDPLQNVAAQATAFVQLVPAAAAAALGCVLAALLAPSFMLREAAAAKPAAAPKPVSLRAEESAALRPHARTGAAGAFGRSVRRA